MLTKYSVTLTDNPPWVLRGHMLISLTRVRTSAQWQMQMFRFTQTVFNVQKSLQDHSVWTYTLTHFPCDAKHLVQKYLLEHM